MQAAMRLFFSITGAGAVGLALLANAVWAQSPTEQLGGHTRSEQGELGDSSLQLPAELDPRQRRD